jgi:hypothetical protein
MQRYDALIKRGLNHEATLQLVNPLPPNRRSVVEPHRVNKNLLDRFESYKMKTLRFMTDSRVPVDNNQAERDIRMCKLKKKTRGIPPATRSPHIF